MNSIETIKNILIETLNLGAQGSQLCADSALLGAVAELDSMAVIHVITRMEECFGFSIEDDEINAQVFETVGSLCAFVDAKLR